MEAPTGTEDTDYLFTILTAATPRLGEKREQRSARRKQKNLKGRLRFQPDALHSARHPNRKQDRGPRNLRLAAKNCYGKKAASLPLPVPRRRRVHVRAWILSN